MSAQILTRELVRTLTCPPQRAHLEVFDGVLRGFYVDVLANGRMNYRVRYRVNGKAKVLTLGDAQVLTVEEARELARAALRQVHAGQDPKVDLQRVEGMSVKTFFIDHYLPYVKSYKRSWCTDESMIRNHVITHLGDRVMVQLTAKDIAAVVGKMREAQYAPGTCNRFLVLMRYGLKLAIRWNIDGMQSNPAKDLGNLKDDNRIERFLTPAQSKVLLGEIIHSPNTRLGSIIPFLILTGARKREVLDAKWVDVDLEQRLWRIPKTKSGKVRHVPLSAEAIRVLMALRAEASPAQVYVFANPATGKPFVSIYYSWDTCRKRAGLPDFRIHDLRHSFASFLVNAGRSLYEVQQLLGHADIRTTSRYAHLSRDRLREAVETVPVHLPED